MTPPNQEADLTLPEAAEYLGITRRAFIELLLSGTFAVRGRGAPQKVKRADVETYKKNQQQGVSR